MNNLILSPSEELYPTLKALVMSSQVSGKVSNFTIREYFDILYVFFIISLIYCTDVASCGSGKVFVKIPTE